MADLIDSQMRIIDEDPLPGDAPDVWDAGLPPGGYVCGECGLPTESEPCPDHQQAKIAAQSMTQPDPSDRLTPAAEAGKMLLANIRSGVAAFFADEIGDESDNAIPAAILAIEQEARADAAAQALSAQPVVCLNHCGSLDWTLSQYGAITHKHSCPRRTTSFCQTHRDGCPDTALSAQPTDDAEPTESLAVDAFIRDELPVLLLQALVAWDTSMDSRAEAIAATVQALRSEREQERG